ncbi:MAG: energy transducer TonB [Thermoanaerobaculaceae bacterium]|nr:energy transducer TonB [Thermoanaerobaculaceae bacterium]TAM46483.1 MAG: TonB C-terminal domain-containing protein [Acidobacteriota bacterium]
MFGAPDRDPSEEFEPRSAAPSRLAKLLETEAEEAPWPLGDDQSGLFLLNERVSPRPLRLRDRPLLLALVISIAFHVLLFTQLRTHSLLQTIMGATNLQIRPKPPTDNTPFYEFVHLPKQRREEPSRRAPASDLDRRAHGGVGAPALTPGSRGTTPELRLEPRAGGETPKPSRPGQGERIASQAPGRSGAETGEGGDSAIKTADKGADSILVMPKEGGGAQKSQGLKGLGGYGALGSPGGAVPDRRGGQVDLGPLTFDTQWYDWGPYAAEMLRRIRYHWEIPEIAQMGVPGVVRIHFFIERNGTVTGIEIQSGSGRPPLDFAAHDAIRNASPLPPLPADLGGVFHEGVTITFYYNTPVPERSEGG